MYEYTSYYFHLLYFVHNFIYVDTIAISKLFEITISALKKKLIKLNRFQCIDSKNNVHFIYIYTYIILTAYISTLFSLSSFGYNMLLHS